MGTEDLERWVLIQCQRTETGCVVWRGATDSGGYGKLKIGGRNVTLHRWIFENHHGLLREGEFACHRCDVRLCVNIEHLFRGDHQDNMRDMVEKGRQARGERNASAKLSQWEVEEILRSGEKPRFVAKRLGIPVLRVYKIRQKQRWKHVEVKP